MRILTMIMAALLAAAPAWGDENQVLSPGYVPSVPAPAISGYVPSVPAPGSHRSVSGQGTSAAPLTPDDKAQIVRIENYLGAIKSISSRFSQVSPDGSVSNGKFYLQRPGKLRMEYDPPTPVLVVTAGGTMVYYDKDLDQVTNIPLSSSLVNFLTRDVIKFDNTVTITRFEQGPQIIRISFVQREKPKDGMMTLEFADRPLALRNIIVTDSSGQATTVSLADAQFDKPLDPSLFVFKDPHIGRKGVFKR